MTYDPVMLSMGYKVPKITKASELPAIALPDQLKALLVTMKLKNGRNDLPAYIVLLKTNFRNDVYPIFKEWRSQLSWMKAGYKYSPSISDIEAQDQCHLILYLLTQHFNKQPLRAYEGT